MKSRWYMRHHLLSKVFNNESYFEVRAQNSRKRLELTWIGLNFFALSGPWNQGGYMQHLLLSKVLNNESYFEVRAQNSRKRPELAWIGLKFKTKGRPCYPGGLKQQLLSLKFCSKMLGSGVKREHTYIHTDRQTYIQEPNIGIDKLFLLF